MVTATRKRQMAFQETHLEDTELEDIAKEHLEAKELAQPPAKRYRAAKKQLREAIEQRGLTQRILEERVRVGEFVIIGVPREGGPTDIPKWSSVQLKVEAAVD